MSCQCRSLHSFQIMNITLHLLLTVQQSLVAINSESCQRLFPKAFASSYLKLLCCLIGIWANSLLSDRSWTSIYICCFAWARVQFGTYRFVPLPCSYSETNTAWPVCFVGCNKQIWVWIEFLCPIHTQRPTQHGLYILWADIGISWQYKMPFFNGLYLKKLCSACSVLGHSLNISFGPNRAQWHCSARGDSQHPALISFIWYSAT